jgi:hypothetical protein
MSEGMYGVRLQRMCGEVFGNEFLTLRTEVIFEEEAAVPRCKGNGAMQSFIFPGRFSFFQESFQTFLRISRMHEFLKIDILNQLKGRFKIVP